MSNFKLVAPYCGVSNYDKTFFVYYMNTEENLRREYIFNTDEDASNFSHAIENLTAFMKCIPARKKRRTIKNSWTDRSEKSTTN